MFGKYQYYTLLTLLALAYLEKLVVFSRDCFLCFLTHTMYIVSFKNELKVTN